MWLDLLKYLGIHGSPFAGCSRGAPGASPVKLCSPLALRQPSGDPGGTAGRSGDLQGAWLFCFLHLGARGVFLSSAWFSLPCLFSPTTWQVSDSGPQWGQLCPRDTAGSGVTWGGHIRDGIGTRHTEARAAARMHRTGPAEDPLVPDVSGAGTGKAWS